MSKEPERRTRDARLAVIAVAVVAAVAKAWLAWTTVGQEDTAILWPRFLQAVHDFGPVGVYGQELPGLPYNHPPLTGWWLVAVDMAHQHLAVPLGFLIRIGSVVADAACGWLIFEVLRRRQPLWPATAAGVLVAASPVLFVISGYHGNHDTEIMFLAILSAYLLVDRRWPIGAGLALAAAVGLKLPAATVVPVVFAAAYAISPRVFARFAAAFAGLTALLWLPPLIAEPEGVVSNVLLYSGFSFPRQWGIVEFINAMELPPVLAEWYVSPGRMLVLLLCAAAGAWIALRRPDRTVAAIGLTMAAFLLLSPGYAPQYMAWPVAAIYALSFWPATVYNLATGAFLVGLYTAWSGGIPWDSTTTVPLTHAQVLQADALWAVLAVVVVLGARDLFREVRQPTSRGPGSSPALPSGTVRNDVTTPWDRPKDVEMRDEH